MQNSQFLESIEKDGLTILPEVFSPDNDGYNDVCSIAYSFNETEAFATICIFDVSGRKIKTLANNELINPKGAFYWDGTDDNGTLCGIGIYIITLEGHAAEGKLLKEISSVVLARKF